MAIRPDAGAGSPSSLGGFSPPGDWGAGSPSSLGGEGAPLGDDTGAGSPQLGLFPVAAIATSLTTIDVIFNNDVDPDILLSDWSIAPVGLAAGVILVDLTVSGAVVTLTTYGNMTPGGTYELTASKVGWAGTIQFTVPAAFATEPLDDLGLLRGLLHAFGTQLNRLKGAPRTRLAIDWAPGESTIFSKTTLGFPAAGAIFVGQYRFTYVGKTSTAFLLCQPDMQDIQEHLVENAPIVFDDRYWLPADILALPNVRDYLDPWYVQEAIIADFNRGRVQA